MHKQMSESSLSDLSAAHSLWSAHALRMRKSANAAVTPAGQSHAFIVSCLPAVRDTILAFGRDSCNLARSRRDSADAW